VIIRRTGGVGGGYGPCSWLNVVTFLGTWGRFVVPAAGALAETGGLWEPYRLIGPDGECVEAVAEFLRDLQGAGRSAATQRSHALALLRWFRLRA
jgi:hypothetical protein